MPYSHIHLHKVDKDKDREFADVNEPTMLQDPMVLDTLLDMHNHLGIHME